MVFSALANGEQGFTYKEYKGSPGKSPQDDPVSRVLSVAIKGDKAYIELKTGPGKLTATGAITPHGKATSETNVVFNLPEARRLGYAVMAYLQAWDVMRLLHFRHVVGQPPCYELVSAGNDSALTEAVTVYNTGDVLEDEGLPAAQGELPRRPSNGVSPTATALIHDRPVTNRHLTALRYGNGKQVGGTTAERQAFQQFQQVKGRVPHTPEELRGFYQAGTAV